MTDAIVTLDAPLLVLVVAAFAITLVMAYAAGYVHGGNAADQEHDLEDEEAV